MIRPLRRRHRWMIVVVTLAVVLHPFIRLPPIMIT